MSGQDSSADTPVQAAEPGVPAGRQKRPTPEGMARRSAVDTETVRALLFMNGGGSVALLAFLPVTLSSVALQPLAGWILWALLFFLIGLVFTVTHNHLRRRCSIAWEYERPKAVLLGAALPEPWVCMWSWLAMWAGVASFLAGGVLVFVGGQTFLPPVPWRFVWRPVAFIAGVVLLIALATMLRHWETPGTTVAGGASKLTRRRPRWALLPQTLRRGWDAAAVLQERNDALKQVETLEAELAETLKGPACPGGGGGGLASHRDSPRLSRYLLLTAG